MNYLLKLSFLTKGFEGFCDEKILGVVSVRVFLVYRYYNFCSTHHDPSYTGEIHLIPSALRSEALAGSASTTVRENVGSPNEDCFALFFTGKPPFTHLVSL